MNWSQFKAFGSAVLSMCFLLTFLVPVAHAQQRLWLTQFGTGAWDEAWAVAPDDAGGVYVGGVTKGPLGGIKIGTLDGFLARYTSEGDRIWIKQIGARSDDRIEALASDAAGGVYIAGATATDLGGPNAGDFDAYVARYNSEGDQVWILQFGKADYERVLALSPDGDGGVYAAGYTEGELAAPSAGYEDAFLAHFDEAGNQSWVVQFGTDDHDEAFGLAPDGDRGVYVGGRTRGVLGGVSAGWDDAFLARYDRGGAQTWIRQFGTLKDDRILALASMTGGDVIVGGRTDGDLGGILVGRQDAFVARYDDQGTQIWVHQFGSSENDAINAVVADGAGGFFAAGMTDGNLVGSGGRNRDVFLFHFDGAGNEIDALQFGSSGNESIDGLATDGLGGVFFAGGTTGDLASTQVGPMDVFLGRFGKPATFCYADCDQSSGVGVLDIADFLCFQNSFVTGEPYACDCDTSTGNGVCDVFDFLCFQDAFVAGCP